MRDVIDKIVKTEQDADKIILAAREKAAAMLAEADAEISSRLQEVKRRERERVAAGQAEWDAREAERIKAAVDEAQRRFAVDEDSQRVQELAERVADRLKHTVFEE